MKFPIFIDPRKSVQQIKIWNLDFSENDPAVVDSIQPHFMPTIAKIDPWKDISFNVS